MTSSDHGTTQYVELKELLVPDSVYDVIIESNVESQHLGIFGTDGMHAVIAEEDCTVQSEGKHGIRVYQSLKDVTGAQHTVIFKEEISVDDTLVDESAQAVKTILSPSLSDLGHQQDLEQRYSVTQAVPVNHDSVTTSSSSGSQNPQKIHKCPHCQYCSSTSFNLKVHVNNRHTNEVKYECDQCSFFTYTKSSLNYHMKSHNDSEYRSCSQCNYRTHHKSALTNHIKTHQKERPYKCPHCPYAAARKMTLKEHIEGLHSSQREIFSCDKCSYQTSWIRALKKHSKSHDGDTFNCEVCLFQTDSKTRMIEHESTVHNIERKEFLCQYCEYCTDQQYKLEDHVHKRHDNSNKILLYSCEDCDYKTKWKRLIKGHRRVHTGELFRCNTCDFATITKTRLHEHEKTHLDMSERSFACPHCSYRATRQARLNQHVINRHFPEKKTLLKCDKCDFTTLWKSYLKLHEKVHTGDVFRCERCPYISPVRAQMIRHERTLHKIGIGKSFSGSSQYKCSHCSFSSTRKRRLREHEAKHQKDNKIYSCHLCSFKTILSTYFKIHMASHREDYMKCTVCSYESMLADKFKKHLETHVSKEGFNCTLCDFTTSSREAFNEHLLLKHNTFEGNSSMSRRADVVGINYLDSHELPPDCDETNHSNSDSKVYKCHQCDFEINFEDAFKSHMVLHIEDLIEQVTEKESQKSKLVYRKVTDGAVIPAVRMDIIY